MRNGKFGFGVVGCGVIAPTHVQAIKACPEAELVAVCDIDEPKGRAFATEHGAGSFYRDFKELVRDPAVASYEEVAHRDGVHRLAVPTMSVRHLVRHVRSSLMCFPGVGKNFARACPPCPPA